MAFKKLMNLRHMLTALGTWTSLALGIGWLAAYWLLKPDPAVLAVGISFLALALGVASYGREPR